MNIFSQINQFISRLPNFIALNLKEKSMRYDFFSKNMHWNLKTPRKNSGREPLHESFRSRRLKVKCRAFSSKQENTVLQWVYELHSASATVENWYWKAHMLKISYMGENTCTFLRGSDLDLWGKLYMERMLCPIAYICQMQLDRPLICALCSKGVGYRLL